MNRFPFSTALLPLAVLAVFLLAPAPVHADDDMSELLDDETQERIDKGLEWIVENQNRDGSWGCQLNMVPSTAVTGMAILSLLASGSTPSRGEHRKAITKGLHYILSIQRRDGAIAANDATTLGIMYEHGSATIMLAELYGMDPSAKDDKEIREKLYRAVRWIGNNQNRDGGWGTNPGGPSDLAVTGLMWNALRCAHNAGIDTASADMDRLLRFVRSCELSDGTYSQTPGQGNGRLLYPTAAGLRIIVGMGEDNSKKVEQGCRRLAEYRLDEDYGGQVSEWDYAAAFYAVQAIYHKRDFFDGWYDMVRRHLLRMQHMPAGYWEIEYCTCCRAYATAIALIVLQSPKKLLPLFQL